MRGSLDLRCGGWNDGFDGGMVNQRPFLSSSVRVDGIFDVLILLGLAGSWLGLMGGWHWALDLFSHFRWQYLAACVVAVGWTLIRRRRGVMMVAVATLILNGWLIGRLAMGGGAEAAKGDRLRVVSLNVLTSNPHKEEVLKYLRGVDADLIFLMEVNAAWMVALEGLKETHPHRLFESREDNFGVALFSRMPLVDVRLVEMGEAGVPSIQARLLYRGNAMAVLGTHPLPPMGAHYAAARDAQLRSVAEHVAKLDVPTLLVGDLNSTPWSEGMRIITAGGGLRLSPDAWRPTWKAGSVLAIPIDHALCSEALRIERRRVGTDVGSDHRPIEVEVYWR